MRAGRPQRLTALSRRATPDELQTALQDAIGARMGRYTGDNFYHLGVNIDAYALALPGIPVVAKPKSILVVSVTLWDDLAGKKINAKQKQLYVFESTTPATFISSGLTQTKAVQLGNLSTNMARKIESWLRENEAWFGALPNPAETGAPAVAGGAPGIAPEAIEPVGTTVAPAALN